MKLNSVCFARFPQAAYRWMTLLLLTTIYFLDSIFLLVPVMSAGRDAAVQRQISATSTIKLVATEKRFMYINFLGDFFFKSQ